MNEAVRERDTAVKDKEPAVFLHAIERRYHQGAATLEILKGAELAVRSGQSVALIAPSGTGKSTLLHIAGLLEHPDGGECKNADQTEGRTDQEECQFGPGTLLKRLPAYEPDQACCLVRPFLWNPNLHPAVLGFAVAHASRRKKTAAPTARAKAVYTTITTNPTAADRGG